MSYQRTVSYKTALSVNQQSAYGTGLPDGDLTIMHPFNGKRAEIEPKKWNDADQSGKGHEYTTTQKNLSVDTKTSLEFDCTSFIAAWMFAFMCGQVVTTQPDAPGSPLVYEHKCKPMDISNPAVGKQLPVTSFVEDIEGEQYKYRDMIVESGTLSGKTGEHLKLKIDLQGSGHYETSAITMPGLVQSSFLRFVDINLSYNATDYSADLQSIDFKHTNTLAKENGYYPGSGKLDASAGSPQVRGRCLVSKRQTDLSFKMMRTDNTITQDDLQNTELPIVITAEGDTIENAYNHKIQLDLKIYIEKAKITEEKDFYSYDITAKVIWDDALNAPFEATITNDVPAYLTPAV